MNPKVDFFFNKAKQWKEELEALRTICLDSGLEETLKWGVPCYVENGHNVMLIHAFNEYCALLFMKGALLKDPKGILIQQTENVQSARQIRFTGMDQLKKLTPAVKQCIKDAIAAERAGLKVEMKSTSEFKMAEEFRRVLEQDAELKRAFQALTPGRQRGYLLHFSSAKLAKTRESRVAQCIPMILDGKGLND